MNKSITVRYLLAVVLLVVASTGILSAATTTRTTSYVSFRYEGDGFLKWVFVFWDAKGEITSLDAQDRYKVFRVAVRGEFHTNRRCTSLSHSRPACYDQYTGSPNRPLKKGMSLRVGDSWFVGMCEPDSGYQAYGVSYVYGASSPVTRTRCGAANCN